MALQTWIGTTNTTLSTGSNWQSGTIATNDSMQFNSLAVGINNSTGGWSFGTLNVVGCIYIADNFTGTQISIYDGTGGTKSIYNLASRVNGYAMYVGANKTFEYPRINWPRQDNFGDSDVYVGLNGLLVHSVDVATGSGFGSDKSTSTASASNAVKWGPGTWRMGPNGTDTSTLGSVTIREGVVQAGFSSTATGRNPFGYIGTSYSPVYFNGTGVELQFGFFGTLNSFTVPNQLIFTSGGIVKSLSGFSTTLSASPGGSGTITIGNGGGSLTWAANIGNSLSVAAGAALTMSGTNSIGGSTITGSGTINMNGGTISADAPTFTGTVNGTFTYNGSNPTMAGNVAGVVSSSAGDVNFTNANNTGYIDTLGYTIVRLKNSYFGGGSGAWTLLNGNGSVSGPGMLRMVGPGANMNPGRGFGMRAGSHLILEAGSSVVSNQGNKGVYDDVTTPNNVSYVFSDDTSTCTLTSSFYQGATVGGSIFVMAKTGGTLVVNGNFNQDGGGGGKVYSINGGTPWGATSPGSAPTSSPNVNYKGIVRWTGTAAASGCSIAVPQGTLHINSTTETKVGTGLSVSANATLACSSTNAAYAAQITGNVSLAANSVLRFGAPA